MLHFTHHGLACRFVTFWIAGGLSILLWGDRGVVGRFHPGGGRPEGRCKTSCAAFPATIIQSAIEATVMDNGDPISLVQAAQSGLIYRLAKRCIRWSQTEGAHREPNVLHVMAG